MNVSNDDFDSPWKGAILKQFNLFMTYFFPVAAADIDWSREPENLDKEFQSITRIGKNATRRADALVKVFLKSGVEQWVLIHIEVQSQPDLMFEERMYVYNYRIFDVYKKRVASFAVLADQNSNWRPSKFEYEIWGCRAGLVFPSVKFQDLISSPDELLKQKNPFAILVLAHLHTQQTRKDLPSRKKWKVALCVQMLRLGMAKTAIRELVGCIDLMMQLPHNLQQAFVAQIKRSKEVRTMPYMTFLEVDAMERGMERGLKKGMQKGMQTGMQTGMQKGLQKGLREGLEKGALQASHDSIAEVLRARFGRVPSSMLNSVKAQDDMKKLAQLLNKAATIKSLKEFTI